MSEHDQVKHARITVTADPTTANRLRVLAEAKLGRLISAGVPRADAERIASPHGIGREALASVVESLWDEEIAVSEQALSTGAATLPEFGDPPGCSHKQTASASVAEAIILKELERRPRQVNVDRPPQPDHVHKPLIPSPSDISSLVTGAAAALGKLPGAQ